MTVEPLSDEELAGLRKEHVPEDPERHERVAFVDGQLRGTGEPADAHCDSCWEDWPCSVARLLVTLEEPSSRVGEP